MENDNHATVSVDDCRLLTLDRHHHENGNLTVVENGKDFPFEVQRVFYIYDPPPLPSVYRGGQRKFRS